MQPLTYAVTIPSALSLYSLGVHDLPLRLQWTPAAKFLAVAMVSLAGRRAPGRGPRHDPVRRRRPQHAVGRRATSTTWRCSTSGWSSSPASTRSSPELTGREWYSARLADWHLVLTVVGGYGSVVPWMLQGLEGAPRRLAVLPDRYPTMSQIALPFVLLIVIAQAIFFYNLARTLGWRSVRVSLGTPIHSDEAPVHPRSGHRGPRGGALAASASRSHRCAWSRTAYPGAPRDSRGVHRDDPRDSASGLVGRARRR